MVIPILIYCLSTVFILFYVGLIWNKYQHKFNRNPQYLVTAIYLFNFFMLGPVFRLSLPIQFSLTLMFKFLGVSLGSKFQVAGLTGGIACGKSTLAKVLTEMGAIIICLDKLNHDMLDNDESVKS